MSMTAKYLGAGAAAGVAGRFLANGQWTLREALVSAGLGIAAYAVAVVVVWLYPPARDADWTVLVAIGALSGFLSPRLVQLIITATFKAKVAGVEIESNGKE